jgi:uncharacterized surface protein with fasciclin (FAS1) repeats
MTTFKRFAAASAAAFALAFVASCGQPQPAPETTAAPSVTEGAGTTDAVDTATAQSIVDVARANPELSTFLAAVDAAGLAETLSGPGPFTVFAPNNAAFAALGDQVTALTTAEDKTPLRNILTYHVIQGAAVPSTALAGQTATPATVQGGTLTVDTSGAAPRIGGATVTQADIQASNGVIHVIDTVLTPPAAQ